MLGTPAAVNRLTTAGPERSVWRPWKQRSLTVKTTARVSGGKLEVTCLVYESGTEGVPGGGE